MLSVIIPAFNRERTIPETIRSVLDCGCTSEVIVVDDGSADRTADVAASVDPRVVVVRRANGGPAAARNTGFQHAHGDYLAFLDSDDRWRAGVLPDVLALMAVNPTLAAVFCETQVGNPQQGYAPLSESTGRGTFAELLTDPIAPDLYRMPRWPFVRRMLDRNQMFLGSTVVRRSAMPTGEPFDPDLFGGEDYEFALRLAAAGGIGYYARPLAQYEKHVGGLSADPDRMAREFAKAVAAFQAKTPDLPPTEAALARQVLAKLNFDYGYRLYNRGKSGEARWWFRRAIRGDRAGRAAALWLLCHLPGGVVRRLRSLKHAGG